MEVGKTADAVGVPDQTWDSRNNPSFKEAHLLKDNYRGLIDRMSRHNKNWLQGTNQNVKRLYGNVKLDENQTIVFAETFNTRFVNRAPVSAITQSERFVSAGFTQNEFKEADEQFLLKLEEVLEKYDKDEVEFPDLEIAFYPNNAVRDRPAPSTCSQRTLLEIRFARESNACSVRVLAAYSYAEGCQRLDDGPNHDRHIRHDDVRRPLSNAARGGCQFDHPCVHGILGRRAEHWDCHGIPWHVWDGIQQRHDPGSSFPCTGSGRRRLIHFVALVPSSADDTIDSRSQKPKVVRTQGWQERGIQSIRLVIRKSAGLHRDDNGRGRNFGTSFPTAACRYAVAVVV
eukprot:2753695-Prymnesium_polylepis.2